MYVIVPRVVTSDGIGARVKEARLAAGWKRVKLAAEADITPNTVRNYEEGLTAPQIPILRSIAGALDVDLMWLIDGDRVGEEVA
jgi:transcriptional regulator with XRE-family HTH domain